MSNYTLRPISELSALHHGAVKLAGAELGVESFGIQVLDFPPGFADYPEHDHAEEAQEEVYAVLAGSGEFTIDGETVPVNPDCLLRVAPEARRKLTPGPQGIRLLAIGCSIGQSYERPEGFRLAVRS